MKVGAMARRAAASRWRMRKQSQRTAMLKFRPDERQRRLIEEALEAHRQAQTNGQFAPDRLLRKWSSEVGILPPACT